MSKDKLVSIALDTKPTGAKVYIYQIDRDHQPLRNTELFLGTSPIRAEVPPGMYFVVAVDNENRFNEVYRTVPTPQEQPFSFSHEYWERANGYLKLDEIEVRDFSTAHMVQADDCWIDVNEVEFSLVDGKTYVGNSKKSKNGKATNLRISNAISYMESRGKRIASFQQLFPVTKDNRVQNDLAIDELTLSLAANSKLTKPRDFRLHSDNGYKKLPEFATNEDVGFRGVRSLKPYCDQ